MQPLFRMCAFQHISSSVARASLHLSSSVARAFYARPFARSSRPGARVSFVARALHARCLVHCVCILCTLTPLLLSCEKPVIDTDSVVSGSAADKDPNLTVSVFQIEQMPFTITRSAKPASEACTRMNFAIYNTAGSRVKQVNQVSTDADFGKASFRLEKGTYQVLVVGHSSSGNPTMTNPAKIQFTNTQGFSDTFTYYGEVTIGDDNVDLPVSLDRITSLCRFVLTDESIPSEVKKMQFYYTGGSGAFDAQTGYGSVKSKQTVTYDVSASQRQFDLYSFPYQSTEATLHLTISALDASGGIYSERELDVPIQQNYITWVSGAFFSSGSTSSTIGVTINTDWAGETHITF